MLSFSSYFDFDPILSSLPCPDSDFDFLDVSDASLLSPQSPSSFSFFFATIGIVTPIGAGAFIGDGAKILLALLLAEFAPVDDEDTVVDGV